MIGDILKEVRRQLIPREAKGLGWPLGTLSGGERAPRTDFRTLSKDGYEKNALIYACVNELASSASEAKCVVEKKKAKGWEPAPEHRLQKLLDNPNPMMSGFEFWFHVILYESLAGNCYWEIEPSKAGLVVGLWLMRPDFVDVKAMKVPLGERTRKKISHYVWRGSEGQINLPPERVLHFKHPHPRDELVGFPPLAAAARVGDTDNYATDFVQSFFKNAAVPFGIFSTTGYLDDAMEAKVKARLKTMYGSAKMRWHDPLILPEGTDWIQMGASFTDMDFPQLRRITETRICEVFQVPPILVGAFSGLERSTYTNYPEARTSFWLETLMPSYRRRADILNRQLVPQFGKDLRVVWDFSGVKALQEEAAAVWERADKGVVNGWVSVNEARSMAGLEDIGPSGDIFLRGMMLLPTSIGEKPEAPGAKGLELKSAQAPEEAKERWHKAVNLVARSWESAFKRAAQRRFEAEKDALLKILRREGKAATKAAPFDLFLQTGTAYLLASKDSWAEDFAPLFAGVMSVQAENIAGAYGIAWDITRPEVQEFLETYSMEFAKGIQGVSEKALRELVAQSQEEGWSVPTLRKALTAKWDEFDSVRAERIARTETIRSSNAGSQEAWREAGIQKKQWYTSIDGRQCAWCESMHEKVVSIEGNFAEAGQMIMGDKKLDVQTTAYPPLHPNCRCTILAYFE